MTEMEIKKFADDISEASTYAQTTIFNETKAFIKKNHTYHSTRDYKKAHSKDLNEIKAEELIKKGYRKASDVAKEIFEVIDNITDNLMNSPFYSSSDAVYDLTELKKKYIKQENKPEA